MAKPDVSEIIANAIKKAQGRMSDQKKKPFTDKRTQRSIINLLLEELVRDRRYSGKFVTENEYDEGKRQLILAEVQDEQFGAALKTVADKLLAMYPVNHHLDENGKEREGDHEYGPADEADIQVHVGTLN